MQNNKNGCFKICTNCSLHNNCCTSFNHINAPVLNKDEVIELTKILNFDNFYEKITENLYRLKTKDNKCIFYQNDKCTIYNNRPTDCKLYPFDIIKKDQKYYLILYTLDCINSNELINETNSISELIALIIPWIDDFTNSSNYTKMRDMAYIILKEININ